MRHRLFSAILGAVLFHLVVLVAFKMGAFFVLAVLEMEGGASRLSNLALKRTIACSSHVHLHAITSRVPPLAGFLSKFLVVAGL